MSIKISSKITCEIFKYVLEICSFSTALNSHKNFITCSFPCKNFVTVPYTLTPLDTVLLY